MFDDNSMIYSVHFPKKHILWSAITADSKETAMMRNHNFCFVNQSSSTEGQQYTFIFFFLLK